MTITKTNDIVKFYSLSEVSQKNGKDCKEIWIVIKDSVYDVTNYMGNHPGGSELILEHAGKDCTNDFTNFGHSSDASKILKTLKVGELVEVRIYTN
jgi:cytochrome b5